MTVAIACKRLGLQCIANDSDPLVVDAALVRAKFYHAWSERNFAPVAIGHAPRKHDNLSLYRFLDGFQPGLTFHAEHGMETTIPHSNVPRGLPPRVNVDAYDHYCELMVWYIYICIFCSLLTMIILY
jgi:hypothetical protein